METTENDFEYQSTLVTPIMTSANSTNGTTTTSSSSSSSSDFRYRPLDPCGPGWIEIDPNPIEYAYAMFASILLHLSKPDGTSVQVAHHLLQLGGRSNNP
jgi:hypothetical protein